MSNHRTSFREYLDKIIIKGRKTLKDKGWLDPRSQGPSVETVEPLILPFDGIQEEPPPDHVLHLIDISVDTGTAEDILENIFAAKNWYTIGQYKWRGKKTFAADQGKDIPHLASRDTVGQLQLQAAVCSDRAGNPERAEQLYSWAAENRKLTQEEFQESHNKQPSVIWERLPYRAYALACLNRWEEALETAERCQDVVNQDRRAQTSESYRTPLQVLAVVLALARYQVQPTEEHKLKAREQLDPQSVSTRHHSSHLYALFYLYNLRDRHPELAHPESQEVTGAARARQGAQACVDWMAEGGLDLDYSPESLKRLDKLIQPIYQSMDQEDRKMKALFLWGCYLGEVTRRELAGGQWQFTEDFWDSSLYWDMGEIEFNMWVFQYLQQYLHDETPKTLFQAWKETEQAYLEYGSAAQTS